MSKIISLKKRVMTRVYIEYTKNLVVAHPDYFMFLVFVITSFTLVSTFDVLNNIPQNGLPNVFRFFLIALRDTSWILQVLVAGFVIRVIVGSIIYIHKNRDHINLPKWSPIKLRC